MLGNPQLMQKQGAALNNPGMMRQPAAVNPSPAAAAILGRQRALAAPGAAMRNLAAQQALAARAGAMGAGAKPAVNASPAAAQALANMQQRAATVATQRKQQMMAGARPRGFGAALL